MVAPRLMRVRSAAEARRVVTDRFARRRRDQHRRSGCAGGAARSELVRTRALANVRLAEARLERTLKQP